MFVCISRFKLFLQAFKKQTIDTKSSAEVEYSSFASLVVELTQITCILCDIDISLVSPPLLCTDNVSTMHLTKNIVLHARTKNIEIDYHFVREKVVQMPWTQSLFLHSSKLLICSTTDEGSFSIFSNQAWRCAITHIHLAGG